MADSSERRPSLSVSVVRWHFDSSPGALRWYQKPAIKLLIKRILIRIIMISVLLGTASRIPWHDIVRPYVDWIESFDLPVAVMIFFFLAIPFCAFTPGSYAPTVLAGATFGPWIATFISFGFMNIAALLNLVTIRLCGRSCVQKVFRRRLANFSSLNPLIEKHPMRTVILLRLPFLASGILNYVFSLSSLPLRPYVLGNLVGLAPGCLLFSLLGSQARSLAAIVIEPNSATVESVLIAVFVLLSVLTSVAALVIFLRRKVAQEIEGAQVEKLKERENGENQENQTENNQQLNHQTEEGIELASENTPRDTVSLSLAPSLEFPGASGGRAGEFLDQADDSAINIEDSLFAFPDVHVHLRVSPVDPQHLVKIHHNHNEFQDFQALRKHLLEEH